MRLQDLRDQFWNYPDWLFASEDSLLRRFFGFYANTRPVSILISSAVIFMLLTVLVVQQAPLVLGFNKDTYYEGVIVSTDVTGLPTGPQRLNPLQVSIPQLDKNILELIYEPLISINQNGEIEPRLAENFSADVENNIVKGYRFSLRKNITWHDGTALTTKDVEATFKLIQQLGKDIPDIYGGNITQNLKFEVLDDYLCRFVLEGQAIPNFYELITFKILPASKAEEFLKVVNAPYQKVDLPTVGQGPYKIQEIGSDYVNLIAHDNYYKGKPQINKVQFKLFTSEEEAVRAFQAGKIHSISNLNAENFNKLSKNPNAVLHRSNIIYTQYFGMYFNLSENGPEQVHSKAVRQAFSKALDRETIVNKVFAKAEPAYNSIPPNSPYYVASGNEPKYDVAGANKLLDTDGWVMNADGIRQKGELTLTLNLSYADNPDRNEVVAGMQENLARVGIQLIPNPVSPTELVDRRVNQDFDLMFLGVTTFVDPDRFEFFHSSQTADSEGGGSNISSYTSEKTIKTIVGGKLTITPRVDELLDNARKLAEDDFDARFKQYKEFQEIIADEVPVVFIYYPSISYLTNDRVKNIDLSTINSPEQKYQNIQDWEIVYN